MANGHLFGTVDDPSTVRRYSTSRQCRFGNGKFANYQRAKGGVPARAYPGDDVNGQGIATRRLRGRRTWPSHMPGAGEGAKSGRVQRPVLYFSVSNWQAIKRSLHEAGLTRNDVRIWTAHYTGKPHLCSLPVDSE